MVGGLKDWVRPSAWALQPAPSSFAPDEKWSNADLDPVPPSKRTWSTWNYVAYWISDATNVAAWELASSMLAIGLSWKQALPAIAVGHTIIAVVMVLNGTIGARLHVPFPVVARASFGYWFSLFAVVSRVVLSMFWFGVQTYTGSECMYQMLKAIFPSIAHMPNHLPANAGITTSGMLCYFLYWLVQLPFLLVSPQKIRWLFTLKAAVVPAAWLALLAWACARVPLSSPAGFFREGAQLSGPPLAWAWLSALNSALGLYATLAVNIPDFTRYARTARAQTVQLAIIPVAFTLAGFVGLAVTSAGVTLYGEVLWDPLHLIDRWDNRAAAFFAPLAFALATLGTNVSANSLSAGNDMAVLFPRFVDIRRGQVLCALVGGWALCPWAILASAQGFLSFMNAYSVFLGPFAGVIAVDYYLVRAGRIDVPALYRPRGRYRYTAGVNWRAALALLVSVPPNLPGLVRAISPRVRIGGAQDVFDFAWIFGFVVASVVYSDASVLAPPRETFITLAEMEEVKRAIDGLDVPEGRGRDSPERKLDEKGEADVEVREA